MKEMSDSLISTITDKIVPEIKEWRPSKATTPQRSEDKIEH